LEELIMKTMALSRWTLGLVFGLALCLNTGADAGVVGAWLFNENSGTSVGDSSGNGLTGTMHGTVQWVPDGQGVFGSALRFADGQCIDFGPPTPPALMMPQDVSFTVWCKPHQVVSHWQVLLSMQRGSSNGEAYAMTYGNNDDQLRVILNTTGGIANFQDPTPLVLNEWVHAAATYDGRTVILYRNGQPVAQDATSASGALDHGDGAGRFAINGNYNSLNGGLAEHAVCSLDEVVIFDEALSQDQIQGIMEQGFLAWRSGPGGATDPAPKTAATDVPFDTMLSWTAGEFAATHDVYLGTTFLDVNDATRTDPRNVLVSRGQTAAAYDPAALEYGQTYFWRVDEVNAAPDNTIFKGRVWSFAVEPYGYPIQPVAATASSSQANMGPEKTIDGSGLTKDLHGTEPATMWLSAGAQPNWIQYEFDQVYKLHEMQVWNSNQLIESFLGFGAKVVTIETSADGTTWTPVPGVPEFNRAPGTTAYAANTTVNLGGAEAKYVKLTISANWGGTAPQTGLSEVRFSYVPLQAREPQPPTGTTGVGVDPDLSWRPGREATAHQVFFGTDLDAVAQGTAPVETVTEHSYTPAPLAYGTQYYWKVDEVGAAATHPGGVWSFSTADFAVVDDFESYTDEAGNEIFTAWVDGYGTTTNGAQVGYVQAPFAERTILHGGAQSMPLAYDNAGGKISEATRTFQAAQDWNGHGIKSLSLYFYGSPDNTGQLYVKINGTKVAYKGTAADLQRKQWQPWNIDLATIGADVSNVTKLTIGLEGAGAAGILYVDDIRLYPRTPELLTPTDPGQTGLVAEYLFDNGANDTSGNGYHGEFLGNAHVANSELILDGTDDAVFIPRLGGPTATYQQCTYSMWMYSLTKPASSGIMGGINYDNWSEGGGIHCKLYNGLANVGIWGMAGGDLNGTTVADSDEWIHLALTVTDTTTTLYLNGRAEAARTFNTPLKMILGRGCIGAYRNNGDIQRELKGRMNDVRIYHRAVSLEELLWLAGRREPVNKPF
jgi:hypothetical protein